MTDARLKSLADRIERLMDERDGIGSDIRDIFAEAKSAGYVPKVLRKAITRKRMDPSKRDEEDAVLELYEDALGGVGRAVAAVRAGATWKEASEEHGVPRATLARAVKVSKQQTDTATETAPDVPGEGAAIGPEIGSGSLATTNGQEAGDALCGCETCVEARAVALRAGGHSLNVTLLGPGSPGWRYACEICGNKRCPHHTNHALACTGSNEPGQPGSSWENYPPPTNELGAVGSPEGDRVAAYPKGLGPDDPLEIPSFLRRQASR